MLCHIWHVWVVLHAVPIIYSCGSLTPEEQNTMRYDHRLIMCVGLCSVASRINFIGQMLEGSPVRFERLLRVYLLQEREHYRWFHALWTLLYCICTHVKLALQTPHLICSLTTTTSHSSRSLYGLVIERYGRRSRIIATNIGLWCLNLRMHATGRSQDFLTDCFCK
jgi:hypothetical protein